MVHQFKITNGMQNLQNNIYETKFIIFYLTSLVSSLEVVRQFGGDIFEQSQFSELFY